MKRLFLFLFVLLLATAPDLRAFIEFPVAGSQIVKWDSVGIRIAAAVDNRLLVLNTVENRTTALTPHNTPITAMCWSSRDSLIATGDKDGRVVVVNSRTGKEIHSLDSKYGRVTAVAFDGKLSRLAAGYADGKIRLWSLATGKEIETIEQAVGGVTTLLWTESTFESYLFVGGNTGYFLRDILSGKSSDIYPLDAAVSTSFCTKSKQTAGFYTYTWITGLANGTAIIHTRGALGQPDDTTYCNTGTNEPILSINSLTYGQVIGLGTKSTVSYWHKASGQLQHIYELSEAFISVDLAPNDYQYPAVSTGYKIILYDLSTVTDVHEEELALNTVRTYPNPTTDIISIEVPAQQQPTTPPAIFDYTGKEYPVVFDSTQSTAGVYSADTRTLPAGRYYIVVTTAKGRTSIPLTIVR